MYLFFQLHTLFTQVILILILIHAQYLQNQSHTQAYFYITEFEWVPKDQAQLMGARIDKRS